MTKPELAKKIYEASHLTGEFKLRSGQISNEYFDKYLFEARPQILREIAKLMGTMIPPGTEVLAGLEMGAISVATALSLETGIAAAYIRKAAKPYGTCKFAEGADIKNKKVCVVEDIVTTGGQIIESVRMLRGEGAIIKNVLCVIQRNDGASNVLESEGLKLIPAFTMDFIKRAVL